jgi:hypothetical protein
VSAHTHTCEEERGGVCACVCVRERGEEENGEGARPTEGCRSSVVAFFLHIHFCFREREGVHSGVNDDTTGVV